MPPRDRNDGDDYMGVIAEDEWAKAAFVGQGAEMHPPEWVPVPVLARQCRLSPPSIFQLIRLGVLPSVLRHRSLRVVEPYSAWELLKVRARFRYIKVIEDYVAATGLTELSYVHIARFVERREGVRAELDRK
jgi:hypothetical protein